MKGPQLTRASLYQVSSSVLYGLHYTFVRANCPLFRVPYFAPIVPYKDELDESSRGRY
jgi:hypothetical protein